MRLKSIFGVCLIIFSIVSLPFVPNAKPVPKRYANGMLVCECTGQPGCECDKTKKHDDTTPKIAECGFGRPIRVASISNNRPFGWAEWTQSNGKPTLISRGYGINMFEEIAKKLKLRYQIVGYAKDQDAITDLRKGNLDLLIGVYTPYSTVSKNITPIYPAMFSNVFAVHYLKDKAFEVNGDESLNNKIGMMRRTENIYPMFRNRITPAMSISLETTESSFQKLLTGEADYLIGSPYSIEAELRRYKLHDDIIYSKNELMKASMFMVLTRATDCYKLNSLIGKELEAYNANTSHANQELMKVINDWGERFRDSPSLKETMMNTSKDMTKTTPDIQTTEASKN